MYKKLLMLLFVGIFCLCWFSLGFAQAVTGLTMATGSLEGSYNSWATAVSRVINKQNKTINITTQVSGGGATNVPLVASKKAELGIAPADMVFAAYAGKAKLNNKDLRVIYGMAKGPLYFIVPKDSNINSFGELIGKRVSFSGRGTATCKSLTDVVLDALDLDAEKDFKAFYLSPGEGMTALIEGTINAQASFAGASPQSAYTQAAVRPGIKIFTVTKEQQKKIKEKYPFVSDYTIKAGTYPGVDYDLDTISLDVVLFGRADISESVVYNIVKTMHEHYDELVATYAPAKHSKIEMLTTMSGTPLHIGTQKYLKEKGLMK